jgi:hypothetical protein
MRVIYVMAPQATTGFTLKDLKVLELEKDDNPTKILGLTILGYYPDHLDADDDGNNKTRLQLDIDSRIFARVGIL